MDEQTKKDLLAKREQVRAQLRQAEADTYFFQGQLTLLDSLLDAPKAEDTPDETHND